MAIAQVAKRATPTQSAIAASTIQPMIVHGLIRARRCQLLAITKTLAAIASASQNHSFMG